MALHDLPDISSEIAKARLYFRELTTQGFEGCLPSVQDSKVEELLNLWLELQRAESLRVSIE